MDISKMTDQGILDFMRSRGSSATAIGAAKSKTIADFYNAHNIEVRCPDCLSPEKIRNGTNGSGVARFKCKKCGKNYSLTVNTIFDGTGRSFQEVLNMVHATITGRSTEYIAANSTATRLSASSAWLQIHKILYVLAHMPRKHLSGVIQIDEKYFREVQKGSRALESYLDPSETRTARKHKYRSEAGIFGPEFINVICAVDGQGYYWAKAACLGPMDEYELNKIHDFLNVSYICSDNHPAYSIWCQKRGYAHYVEPSTYRKERQARGYVNTDDIYHKLTTEEYKLDEAINRQMYKEGKYPHIEGGEHDLSYEEFLAIKNKFRLGINAVNSFHNQLEQYLVTEARGTSSEYLEDYIGAYVWLHNYRRAKNINVFTFEDAENILALMCQETIKNRFSPNIHDITERDISHLPRPSKRAISAARTRIKHARRIVIVPNVDTYDKSEYEGEGDIATLMFDKRKFFRSIGTTRLNELCKLYGIYDRKEHKNDRINRICALDNAQDIIFNEVFFQMYGSIAQMQEAFNKMPKKRKRGRPKKEATP